MSGSLSLRRPGFWGLVFLGLMPPFLWVTWLRFSRGLGAVTNLNDAHPWGLWIGFDLLCGVGLAAGAFTLTAIVHLFNLRRFEPIVRPTILTGFLGYVFVILALLFDLGQPWRIWHALIYWNPRSVMFEVAWCVMLYTTVLALEFSPMVFERFGLKTPLKWMHRFITPLVILGVVLSTLHQSSLGSLYLIVPSKLHPLWYSALLPLFFWLSAIGAGIGMVIVESHLSGRLTGRKLELELLEPLARGMVVALALYGLLRVDVIIRNGAWHEVAAMTYEGRMFALEFALGVLGPVLLLLPARMRHSERGLLTGALMAVAGFVVNRLNVSLTGMERAAGSAYLPSGGEVVVSLAMVGLAMACFVVAVKLFPVFPEERRP